MNACYSLDQPGRTRRGFTHDITHCGASPVNIKHPLAAALVLLGGIGIAAADQFSENEAAAMRNLQTREGAAFDRALGMALQASPELEPRMTGCLVAHPGPQAVHGYFHFTSMTEYTLELRPDSAFSRCFSEALEGLPVPAPPTAPYFNHFTFSATPEGGRD
jgi:hypothetical protein